MAGLAITPHPFLSIYSALGSKVSFGFSSRSTRPLDSAEWKDCAPLGNNKRFYGVWDIPSTGDGDWDSRTDELIKARDERPPVLPPQDVNSIRLTIREAPEDGVAFDDKDTSGFTALSSQWRKDRHDSWCHIKTYKTSPPARVLRSIRVIERQHHRRDVQLVCHSFVVRSVKDRLDRKPSGFQFFTTARLALQLKELDGDYRRIRSSNNWKQVFLLQFHHACLRLFANFLANLALRERGDRYGDIDPEWAELRRWTLEEITKHSYECRSLREMSQELNSATESLIDVIKASATPSTNLMAIEAELRGCCRESRERIQKLSDGLEHDLKFLELARDMNQTLSVQQLTLLATIFLPLSLAAGVLSMQTRFKDLGSLLYDFFGVVVLLGAIIIIILIFITAIAICREAESKHLVKESLYTKHVRPMAKGLLILCFFSYGSLVLSSFVVGMFKDVPLGAKILGYGSAAASGLMAMILAPLAFALLYVWIQLRSAVRGPEGGIILHALQGGTPAAEPMTLDAIAEVSI